MMRFRAVALALAVAGVASSCVEADLTISTVDTMARPGVEFAAGNGPRGRWTAWAYRDASGALCFEIRRGSEILDGMCRRDEGPMATRSPVAVWVVGSTTRPGAAAAQVIVPTGVSSGAGYTAELHAAPESLASGVWLYAVELPAGSAIEQVDIVDAEGRTLVTERLR